MKLIAALAAASLIVAPAVAGGKSCRDAKGKFIKCPRAASAAAGVTKDKNGKCHFASWPKKGQFTKCP